MVIVLSMYVYLKTQPHKKTSRRIQPYQQEFMENIKRVVSIWNDTFFWCIKIDPSFPLFSTLSHL